MEKINEVNFIVAGPAGTGVATIGQLFAKCMQRCGLFVYGTNDYPSLIKGGHNMHMGRASQEPVYGIVDKFDILIALDKLSITLHANDLSENATLIYDSDRIKDIPQLVSRKDLLLVGAPLSKFAAESGGEIMFNTVAFGLAMGMLSVDFSIVQELLSRIWARKGEKVINANIAAAKKGYDFSSSYSFKIKIRKIENKKMIFINGNEASVVGAIKAGCKFVAEYPMSPSSSILHLMAGHERDYGIIVKQTEDEIAAANMIAGAAFAGVRAMTATSGGGFSLMVEALGMMGIMEVPCVIFESQRCGPSTGLPTYTEQADLQFVLHASQGEFPRIVIMPGDPKECFIEAVNAFNLAEKLQTPVIVLLDKFLSETSLTTEDFRNINVKIDRGKLLSDEELENQKDFKRYRFVEDGISPRSIPGQKNGLYVCSSYEHDETSFTSEDPVIRVKQITKRAKKLDSVPKELIAPSFFGHKDADVLLVCWGSTKMPMLEALKLFEKENIQVSIMHIRYASPFPKEDVLNALKKAKKVIIFEGNSEAQMRALIMEKTGFYIEDVYLRFDGRPFSPNEIFEYVKNRLKTW